MMELRECSMSRKLPKVLKNFRVKEQYNQGWGIILPLRYPYEYVQIRTPRLLDPQIFI
jgi:hypothetical protein